MAEAHEAVAFAFKVRPDGVDVDFSRELLKLFVDGFLRSRKKRLWRLTNRLRRGVFPATAASFAVVGVVVALVASLAPEWAASWGVEAPEEGSTTAWWIAGVAGISLVVWLIIIILIRFTLRLLLIYKGFLYENFGRVSITTRLWLILLSILQYPGGKPMLNSFQSFLPILPVPPLKQTLQKHLESVRQLLDDADFDRMVLLTREFESTVASKLQFYLVLKSWWATNYVTDWWEELVYLRGRGPLVVNSNYYGVEAVLLHRTRVQAARAATFTHVVLRHKRNLERESVSPIFANGIGGTVPLCSAQYERTFNTVRIPGKEVDRLKHFDSSKHIAVLHRGRYFKVWVYRNGSYLEPCELERTFQMILDDDSPSFSGEDRLAALTAGNRRPWAEAREKFFADGVNRSSLDAIESAAFVVILDEEEHTFDEDDDDRLDAWGQSCFHGNGCNRWFDKSFNLIVFANGRIGFNAEHSWGDAPIMAHLWEYTLCREFMEYEYSPTGHTLGEARVVMRPTRLHWNLTEECQAVISESLTTARELYEDVDLRLTAFHDFGKGLMKKSGISPDAFIQLALQLAYFRDAGKFQLAYESSMTRLFREGRTETVRPCTAESSAWVRAMEDSSVAADERLRLFKLGAQRHQNEYRDAMAGKGVDRHLFCLYVVAQWLEIESPFLDAVLKEPWMLSTSQTPHKQTNCIDLNVYPEMITCGGGFGPVSADGYGVSYIIAHENVIFFHVSSRRSSKKTDSKRFLQGIARALNDIKSMFEANGVSYPVSLWNSDGKLLRETYISKK